ncbi:ribonuclease HII [Asticcacaulis sp. AC460]|uniref:ribonuclease HII n=1 Tax=Asticcacaulis sp. AC460 TaxID=1282360 RepID=UPI0003C3BBF8|nr:ribonuclease HII [Asticcacaulis sp. AC460]ESQ92127.1 ribonuclease HII [Asticcacaulis sp. AC460]
MADFFHEQRFAGLVCGVDEAGRGPCAGPVCVAAVILDPARTPDGIDDSKALTEARRFHLEPLIKDAAVAWSVITMSVEDIDSMNILAATMEGMTRAVMAIDPCAHHALIDGNRCPKQLTVPATAVIGGDALSLSIAAASILAKTARDRIMIELDAVYPQYGFKRHKGYQAAAHLEALRVHGPSPVHRMSWSTLQQLALPLGAAE